MTPDRQDNGFLDYYINVDRWNQSSSRLDLIKNVDVTHANANMNTLHCQLKEDSPGRQVLITAYTNNLSARSST